MASIKRIYSSVTMITCTSSAPVNDIEISWGLTRLEALPVSSLGASVVVDEVGPRGSGLNFGSEPNFGNTNLWVLKKPTPSVVPA